MTVVFQRNLSVNGDSMDRTNGPIYKSLILNELRFIAKTNTRYYVLNALHTS